MSELRAQSGRGEANRASAMSFVLIFAVWLGSAWLGLGLRELWNPVEPRYAGLVAEMRDSGEWLLPREAGEAYDQKPPLVFWLSSAAGALPGCAESRTALRSPSALAALLAAWGIFCLGSRLFHRRVGEASALIFLTAWLPFWSSRFLHLDTALAASLVWLLVCLLPTPCRDADGKESRDDHGDGRRARRRLVAVALLSAAACLIKGPLVLFLALFLASLGARLPNSSRWKSGESQSSGRRIGIEPNVAGAALVGSLLALAWLVAAALVAGAERAEWLREIGWRQGLMRLADERPRSKHGGLYYLASLVSMTAPWGLLVLAGLWRAIRGKLGSRDETRAARWCLFWAGLVFLVLCLGVTRRSRYLMPLLPALCLLAGWAAVDTGRLTRTMTQLSGLIVALSALIVGAVAWEPSWLASGFEWVRRDALPADSGLLCVVESLGAASGRRWLAVALATSGLATAFLASCAARGGGAPHSRAASPTTLLRSVAPTTLMRSVALTTLMRSVALTLSMIWASWGLFGAPAVDAQRADFELRDRIASVHDQESEGPARILLAGNFGYRESSLGRFRWEFGFWPTRMSAEEIRREGYPSDTADWMVLIAHRDLKRLDSLPPPPFRELEGGPFGREKFRIFLGPSLRSPPQRR